MYHKLTLFIYIDDKIHLGLFKYYNLINVKITSIILLNITNII